MDSGLTPAKSWMIYVKRIASGSLKCLCNCNVRDHRYQGKRYRSNAVKQMRELSNRGRLNIWLIRAQASEYVRVIGRKEESEADFCFTPLDSWFQTTVTRVWLVPPYIQIIVFFKFWNAWPVWPALYQDPVRMKQKGGSAVNSSPLESPISCFVSNECSGPAG